MMVRTASLATLVIAGTAGADRPESNATLVGSAAFVGQPHADRGSVRMIVQGVGEIGDSCPDASEGQFLATYDGELDIQPGGEFEAQLYPSSPVIATPSGCAVTDLRVDRVTAIQIVAQLGDLVGHGWLTYQNLRAADETDLMRGAFDNLYAQLVFQPEASCNCGS